MTDVCIQQLIQLLYFDYLTVVWGLLGNCGEEWRRFETMDDTCVYCSLGFFEKFESELDVFTAQFSKHHFLPSLLRETTGNDGKTCKKMLNLDCINDRYRSWSLKSEASMSVLKHVFLAMASRGRLLLLQKDLSFERGRLLQA